MKLENTQNGYGLKVVATDNFLLKKSIERYYMYSFNYLILTLVCLTYFKMI